VFAKKTEFMLTSDVNRFLRTFRSNCLVGRLVISRIDKQTGGYRYEYTCCGSNLPLSKIPRTNRHGNQSLKRSKIGCEMARLILNCNGPDLVTHELTGDVTMIGRASLNHIVIDNPAVSAQHAILVRVGASYRLKDLHSTNGTQVNGVAITDAELKDGDKIRFGSTAAIFVGPAALLSIRE
jgi:hypothetical protein